MVPTGPITLVTEFTETEPGEYQKRQKCHR